MKDLIVSSYATKTARLMPLYIKQLGDAGIDFFLYKLTRDMTWKKLSTVESFINITKGILKECVDYKKIVITDAFDMLFFGTKDELLKKIPDYNILYCADKNLIPSTMDSGSFPIVNTPWRYVNGGALCGTYESILNFLDHVKFNMTDPREIGNTFFNRLLTSQDPGFYIDSDCQVFHNMFMDNGEVINIDGRPFNKLTGSFPNFFHFAGITDWKPFLKEYGIEFTQEKDQWLN